MLISSFVKACNGDVNDFCLSRSTTRRSRIAARFKILQEVLEKMKKNAPRNIALHWDGKLTTDRLGSQYEALSVIASCGGVSDFKNGKLLGITKLESSTGRAQADASYDMLLMWQTTNNIQALVFDTSSNSDWKNGAAKLLEEQLGRKVFYHACRHHIYELVIRAVWKLIFGIETTGLKIQCLRKWVNIDKTKSFKTLNFSNAWLQKKANEVGDEITSLLEHEKGRKNSSLQNDYKECAELTLAIIGYVHHEDVSHHRPGATHSSARWMSQVLCSQKIYMWADQMNYDNETIFKLRWLVTFLVLFYVPAWLECNTGADAATNNLNILQSMLEFKQFDASVSTAAFQKLHKHNWYLTEENVIFSMCNQNIAISKKSRQQMADRLLLMPKPNEFR